jgi:hypothetical protein
MAVMTRKTGRCGCNMRITGRLTTGYTAAIADRKCLLGVLQGAEVAKEAFRLVVR